MRLQVRAHNVELTAGVRDLVNQRIHSALGRFANRVKRVSVRLSDQNGPRGGLDKCCDVVIDAGLQQPLVIRERQVSVSLSVIGAVDRAARTVERRLRLASRVANGRGLSRATGRTGTL